MIVSVSITVAAPITLLVYEPKTQNIMRNPSTQKCVFASATSFVFLTVYRLYTEVFPAADGLKVSLYCHEISVVDVHDL